MIYQYSNYHTFHVDLLSPHMSAGTKTYTACCRSQMRIVLVYSEHRAGLQLKPLHSRPFLLLIPNVHSVLNTGPYKGNWANNRQKISVFLPEEKVYLLCAFLPSLKSLLKWDCLARLAVMQGDLQNQLWKLRNIQLPWADQCSCRFPDASAKISLPPIILLLIIIYY